MIADLLPDFPDLSLPHFAFDWDGFDLGIDFDFDLNLADLLASGDVFLLVAYVDDKPDNLFRTAAGFSDHRNNIREGEIELRHKVVADDLLLFVPANLAGDEEQPASCLRQHTV